MNLTELTAQRDQLNALIESETARLRTEWNAGLDGIEQLTRAWAEREGVEIETATRKNETILGLGHGALEVRLGAHEEHYGPWLTARAGDGVKLEFGEMPEPERAVRLFAAMIGREIRELARGTGETEGTCSCGTPSGEKPGDDCRNCGCTLTEDQFWLVQA